ncbi:arginine kinase-like isoform X1 [Mercenaria mercenaria]|uniref:arginine kinase-like isoform X1 n=1 Tax=Mercenaria mercenaria TaxID=6596 RepID=UPI001E1D8128|nr:arginine kinase-like isoform X1 [Mercenaria mercenaria]
MTDKSLDELWHRLLNSGSHCKSLLKKHLTQPVYNKYKDVVTDYGGTLRDCIASGCMHLKSHCGIYASDPEAYDTFSDVFYPIIREYHKVDKLEHPAPDFGDLNNLGFGDLDPKGQFINSTRIRVGRSHANYGFPPTSTKEDRLEMEKMTVDALRTLRGELAGKYYPLTGMTPAVQKQMTEDHFLFRDDDPVLGDAHGYDDWPAGRGIFFSNNKKFLVWVNEEDHLRIISMQQGGHLAEVWQRLVKGLHALEKKLTFAHHPKFGYLTFCPTNLGTTLRASVHIRIPHLSKHKDFNKICEGLNLQPRGIHGEHSDSVGGVYDISNKRRMGLSEIEAVQEMRRGVEKIIELESGLKTKGKL